MQWVHARHRNGSEFYFGHLANDREGREVFVTYEQMRTSMWRGIGPHLICTVLFAKDFNCFVRQTADATTPPRLKEARESLTADLVTGRRNPGDSRFYRDVFESNSRAF